MLRHSVQFITLAVIAGGAALALLVQAAPPAKTGATTDAVTLKGSFVWTGQAGTKHDLQAIFTPAGERKWDVTFTFTWDNNPMTYKGDAKGSLATGKLTGTASNGGRSWRFSAQATSTRIRGDHWETTGGREQATGTFELKRAP